MQIIFYTCRNDPRQLRKSFTQILNANCNIKDRTSIESPDIEIYATQEINDNIAVINYAYIPKLHRYYYVHVVDMGNGHIIVAHLDVDVLQSFNGDISALTVLVERQEHVYNSYFVDNLLPIRKGVFLENTIIGRVGNANKIGRNYTITATGGKG